MSKPLTAYERSRVVIRDIVRAHYASKSVGCPALPLCVTVGPFDALDAILPYPSPAQPYSANLRDGEQA